MARTPWLGAVALILLAGCGWDDGAGMLVMVRDSAGIQVVENTGPPPGAAAGWSIDPEPLLSLGAQDGEGPEVFSRVLGLFRDSRGRIVVLDEASRQVRFFSADGAFLHATGGPGGGPGEFGRPSGAYGFPAPMHDHRALIPWRGDSMLVFANPPRLLHVLDADGNYVRAISPVPPLRWVHGFPGDSMLLLSTSDGGAEGPPEGGWERARLESLGPEGAVDELGLFALRPEGESGLFGPYGMQAVARDGFVTATSGQGEFRFHDWEGALRRIVRLPLPPGTVSDSTRAATERPIADVQPVMRRFVMDRRGHMWIAPYREDPAVPADSLYLVNAEGAFLGSVALPAGLRPVDIGEDWVLGLWRDAYDVDYVRLHRLRRGG